jgi:hypothetical protein
LLKVLLAIAIARRQGGKSATTGASMCIDETRLQRKTFAPTFPLAGDQAEAT